MELLRIRVVNQYNMIEAVQSCIKVVADQYKMPEKESQRLNLAVEEAMANVINYGFGQENQQYFDVALRVNGNEFTVVVCDKGIPGDFILDNYDDKLGVRIMQHVLDKLIIKNLGFNGREQHLVKYLSAAPAYEKRIQEEHAELPKDTVFDIHPLRRDEVIEVARCIYDEFGFNYNYEHVYYPERFFEACQNGRVYSLAAVAPNGEIAGHLAATRLDDFPGIAEMGIGVVKKKYRKYSIMKELTERILQYCQESSDINALMAEPVAYHPITQKMCKRYGLAPCGFIFQYINSDLSGLSNKRDSVCVAINALRKNGKHRICVPEPLKEMIADIYNSIGIKAEFAEKASIPGPEKTVIMFNVNRHTRLGKIFVYETGKDIKLQIKLAIQTMKREKCQTVILYLNMFDTAMEFCYIAAVNNGFFCTGCLPMADNGDYLCMELFIGSVVDYDMLVTTPAFSALLDKIKALDPDNVKA